MKHGFYTALGTPLNENGELVAAGMTLQVRQQVEAGVSGLLVLGSMGNMTYLKNSTYPKVAACAAEAARGEVPVLVGVTDLSISRVLDRVEALRGIRGIDGIVSTVPYYHKLSQDCIVRFYSEISRRSGLPVYLYDLPGVTGTATTPDTVRRLWRDPNIRGIKSGNLVTQRVLFRAEDRPEGFSLMFSNLDEFDVAYRYGINQNLDGMFSCLPKTAQTMYRALEEGDYALAGTKLDQIIALRDCFAASGCLMAAFTHAMNKIGCEGNFCVDYQFDITDAKKELVVQMMKDMGELD